MSNVEEAMDPICIMATGTISREYWKTGKHIKNQEETTLKT